MSRRATAEWKFQFPANAKAKALRHSWLGGRRISVGGSLARAAWGGFMRAAREIAEQGTFTEFAHAAKGAELNGVFGASG